MKEVFLVIAIPIGILVLAIPLIILNRSDDPSGTHDDPNEWLEFIGSNWEVKFEKAEKEGYEKSSVDGFHGDGCRFVVSQYKDDKSAKGTFPWRKVKANEDAEEIEEVLESLEIDSKYRPDYMNSLIYKKYKDKTKYDKLLIVYDPRKPNNLYVMESHI